MPPHLLDLQEIKKYFRIRSGIRKRLSPLWVKAVDTVSFQVSEGETFALVGESGSGKTTLAKMILFLEKPTSGWIRFKGRDLNEFTRDEMRQYRRQVQAMFQDPYSSLDPRMRVNEIIKEPIRATKYLLGDAVENRVIELLRLVGLEPESARYYPHEFSGGQRQRIALARALAIGPRLMVLDEPVSALDVSIRAQLLNLLKDIQTKFGIAYILIAHDLAVVRHMSTRIGVMYLGRLVEVAETEEFYSNPIHPYSQALLSAALPSRPNLQRNPILLRGTVSSAIELPLGCRFHPRCPKVMPLCSQIEPFLEGSASHLVACHLALN